VERIFDDERSRGGVLSTKAATLAGFSGTILSLVSGLGRDIFKMDHGSVRNVSVHVLFVVSVTALAAAVVFAIFGVLRTQVRLLVDSDQIIAFAGPPWTSADPVDIEGNMLASLGLALKEERRLNDRKARFTDRAALALLTGLLAVASQALFLALG
jgi:hypothetical protein